MKNADWKGNGILKVRGTIQFAGHVKGALRAYSELSHEDRKFAVVISEGKTYDTKQLGRLLREAQWLAK